MSPLFLSAALYGHFRMAAFDQKLSFDLVLVAPAFSIGNYFFLSFIAQWVRRSA